ncbi:hypothetical protein E2605_18435 [Dysgonomonas capnocytophagoides]|uniref:Uncharacterized protein n=1 Tax=Dysgonomonas capnocytophagoides TaxID=45254 RepID=A0A4Y8KV89_9BACT|nr:hypothetical protein [Dysgonomonas capnocytophagoides]TFD92818.1 hypothetical protein E2605_18435 [Dysgonomonas capnocytophagoides]
MPISISILICSVMTEIYELANCTETHISYPKKRKSNLLKKDAIKYTDRDNNRFPKFEDIHTMYVKVRDYKAYSIKSFSKVYDSSSVKHADENDLRLIFKALSDQKYFFFIASLNSAIMAIIIHVMMKSFNYGLLSYFIMNMASFFIYPMLI